jgi:hypothetical protein
METTPELKIVNKFFKEKFPFVLEVVDAGEANSSVNRILSCKTCREEYQSNYIILEIGMYVTPTHFCELMDHRIESKVISKMKLISSIFLKSVFTDWKGEEIRFLFFPDINEQTILNQLTDADS